jgi:hypothetical protein
MNQIKRGARISLDVSMRWDKTPEFATITAWHKSWGHDTATRPVGYHPVRFDDGGIVLMHESRFKVVQ